jgi:hypothetical protein
MVPPADCWVLDHNMLPVRALNALSAPLVAAKTMPFATIGDVPPAEFAHTFCNYLTPFIVTTWKADTADDVPTNIHVMPLRSAQTAGAVKMLSPKV